MKHVTVIIEVHEDTEDDLPIADAVRWSLEGSGCAAIDPNRGERIISITEKSAK